MLPSATGPFAHRAVQRAASSSPPQLWGSPCVEVIAVGYPIWSLFELGDLGEGTLLRTVLPVAVGAAVVWWVAIATWLLPLSQAVAARRRGERVSKELAARAYRITLKGPIRACSSSGPETVAQARLR